MQLLVEVLSPEVGSDVINVEFESCSQKRNVLSQTWQGACITESLSSSHSQQRFVSQIKDTSFVHTPRLAWLTNTPPMSGARESLMDQRGLHAPKYMFFHKDLKEISDFPHSFTYYTFFSSRKVCWEDAYTPKGYGKETTDQEKGMQWVLEMHRLVIEMPTFLTAPGFPLALCQGHDYRVSAYALPAAECSNFFIISGVIFSLHHDDTWAEIFRGGGARRGWESKLRWAGSCSIQLKWN